MMGLKNHIFLFFGLTLILTFFVTIAYGQQYEDEDTIIVEASTVDEAMSPHARSKRQAMIMHPYPAYIYPQQTPAERLMPQGNSNGACMGSNGVRGQCLPVTQCYPNIQISSLAVLSLLTKTLSSCTIQANNYYGLQQQSQPLICCPVQVAQHQQQMQIPQQQMPHQQMQIPQQQIPQQQQQQIFVPNERKWKQSAPIHFRPLMPPNVTPVEIEKYPWTVAIMRGDRHHCGGSLVNKFTVLTAAHCVQPLNSYDVANLRVILGHHDISQSERPRAITRKVIKSIYHRQFSMHTLHNDIALLILEFSAPTEHNVKISAVKLSQDPVVQGKATIAGWGQMGWNLPATPNLMETTIDIWSNRKCSGMYGTLAPGGITSNMICGSAVGKDACRGDSGGPLMMKKAHGYEQIGVVSWGIECGRYPSVHTRIASYGAWIEKNRLD